MATRKSRKRKAESPRFLVVRGKGNNVYVGLALPVMTNAELAKMIDNFPVRPGSGIARAQSALIVLGENQFARIMGGNFGNFDPD